MVGEQIIDWLGFILSICVGALLAAIGCWSTFHAVRQILFWPRVPARILRYWIKRGEGQRFFHPVLQFDTAEGDSMTVISSWGTWRKPWQRSDVVVVRYDPKDPRRAEIDTLANLWGFPLTLFALALWAGLLVYWLSQLFGLVIS